MASLLKKPEKMGTPQIASQQIWKTRVVQGRRLANPPILVMSPEPLMACMTEPAHRKRPALKKAWVKRWKMPPAKLPVPTPTNMKPSWLTVE